MCIHISRSRYLVERSAQNTEEDSEEEERLHPREVEGTHWEIGWDEDSAENYL